MHSHRVSQTSLILGWDCTYKGHIHTPSGHFFAAAVFGGREGKKTCLSAGRSGKEGLVPACENLFLLIATCRRVQLYTATHFCWIRYDSESWQMLSCLP